jgi:hypothetical protein
LEEIGFVMSPPHVFVSLSSPSGLTPAAAGIIARVLPPVRHPPGVNFCRSCPRPHVRTPSRLYDSCESSIHVQEWRPCVVQAGARREFNTYRRIENRRQDMVSTSLRSGCTIYSTTPGTAHQQTHHSLGTGTNGASDQIRSIVCLPIIPVIFKPA